MQRIDQNIKNGDPWYVDPHLTQIDNRSTRRTISKRWSFILSAISDFQKKNSKDNISILDAGCGDGVNLKVLAGRPGTDVYGVDYNPLRLERVRKEFPDAKIMNADLTSLRLDKKFDVILCSQVLEHIKEDEKVLKNLSGLLDNKGILIVGVPNEGCFMARLRNNFFEPGIKKTTDHVNFYRESVIIQKISRAGFMIERKMYEGFFLPHQKLSSFLASFNLGFELLNILGNIFNGQAARHVP